MRSLEHLRNRVRANCRKLLIITMVLFFMSSVVILDTNDPSGPRRFREESLLSLEAERQDGSDGAGRELDFQLRMKGPVQADNQELLKVVREKYLIAPSTKPYNLKLSEEGDPTRSGTSLYNMYRSTMLSFLFLSKVITVLFEDEPPGFFVEAGALDGEYNSNTLYLEKERNWNGLLVEADADVFERLKEKNRKAWASNTCLAVETYPYETVLVKITNHGTPEGDFTLPLRGFSALLESTDLQQRMKEGFPVHQPTQCLPLQTLLLALNITHVQFISLDVEAVFIDFCQGVEIGVLEAFFKSSNNILVDVWAVEHKHPKVILGNKDLIHYEFIHWFESRGYTLYTLGLHSPKDYIFIRNGSNIYDRAFSKRPSEYKIH